MENNQYEIELQELMQKQKEIKSEIEKFQSQLVLLKQKSNIIKNKIHNTCFNIKDGHTMVTEREDGIYGELYTYCSRCGFGN